MGAYCRCEYKERKKECEKKLFCWISRDTFSDYDDLLESGSRERPSMTARSAAQERPPPLPPPRAYTVAGGVKLGYPQTRGVLADWADDAAALRLRAGDTVLAVGAARRGHVAVQVTSARHPARSPLPAPRCRPRQRRRSDAEGTETLPLRCRKMLPKLTRHGMI